MRRCRRCRFCRAGLSRLPFCSVCLHVVEGIGVAAGNSMN